MSAAGQPWGIVVTDTLHLLYRLGPFCGNRVVRERLQARRDVSLPIYGTAGNRKVCKHCIESANRHIERLAEETDRAEAWNEAR